MSSEANKPQGDAPVNKAADLRALEGQFGPESTKELIGAYLDDTSSTLSGMSDAISTRDPKAMKALAHMLKSAARIVGALQLSTQAKKMEDFAVQEDWPQIESFFEPFTTSFNATADYLREYVK